MVKICPTFASQAWHSVSQYSETVKLAKEWVILSDIFEQIWHIFQQFFEPSQSGKWVSSLKIIRETNCTLKGSMLLFETLIWFQVILGNSGLFHKIGNVTVHWIGRSLNPLELCSGRFHGRLYQTGGSQSGSYCLAR